jgi:cytochrome c oxidase subunit 1
MKATEYGLEVLNASQRRIVTCWLALGLAALLGAGVFSLLLILARTPGIQQLFTTADFFRTALVVHVDLSVLIWLLSMSGAMWSLAASSPRPAWDKLSFLVAAAGTVIVAVSPFVGAGDPLMNNYVPLLRHPVFHIGLALFALGIVSHLLRTVFSFRFSGKGLDPGGSLKFGIALSSVITAVAVLALAGSWLGIPGELSGEVYYEFLFWGSGHVLQFSYTLLMALAWVVLLVASGSQFELSPRLTMLFCVILALPVITVPFLYLAHDIVTPGHRLAFTELMKFGGLSCLPLGLAVLVSAIKAHQTEGELPKEARYLRASLWVSMTLFAVGGILGFLISGLDIVIPAHYHGSTVGVTIAFMGLAYYLLPRLGFGALPPRAAFWQLLLYGGGQLLHILGLAWTGGYGVQRKTAGLAQGVDRVGEVAGMGLMGLGGLISVIGGLMFLLVCYASIRNAPVSEHLE